MEFDQLLKHFDGNSGQKEQVALVIFYLEEFEDKNSITQSDVKDVIRRSRSTIKPATISEYFRRLEMDGWISKTEDGGYRLGIDGGPRIRALLDDGAFDSPREAGDHFINTVVFEEHRFQKLVEDINKSYRYHIYDGTLVLTRKLFEHMIFEILRNQYSGKDNHMFFDVENQRHYHFDELLNNFKIGISELKMYTKERLDDKMVEDIRDLKDRGNLSAHSIRVDFEEGEVEALSGDATYFAEILHEIWKGVQNANGSTD